MNTYISDITDATRQSVSTRYVNWYTSVNSKINVY